MDSLGRILRRIGSAASTLVSTKRTYACEIVASGTDLNGAKRSAEMLRAAAPKFEGRPCKVLAKVGADGKPVNDHQGSDSAWGREVLNTIGTFQGVRYDDAAFEGRGGLVGSLVLFDGVPEADGVAARLDAIAASAGAAPLGLSFSGLGHSDAKANETIESVDSVDIVTFPAAGGAIGHRLAASLKGESMNLAKLIAALAAACPLVAAGLPANVSTQYALGKHVASKLADETVRASFVKAMKLDPAKVQASTAGDLLDTAMGALDQLRTEIESAGGGAPPAPPVAASTPPVAPVVASTPPAPAALPGVDTVAAARVAASVATIDQHATRIRLEAACRIAKLPDYATTRLVASIGSRTLTDAEALELANGRAAEIDEVRTHDVANRVRITMEPAERISASIACLMSRKAPKPTGLDPYRDFSGSFNAFLEKVCGIDVRLCREGRTGLRKVKAAVDATNFDSAFDDGINRALLAEYKSADDFSDQWRKIANIVPENDFRTKEVIASTWYDELPAVAERAPYELLTTPTDRKETYALAKRGGIETISWETMLNDDLGMWQSMLKKMARSARETLNERVFVKIRRATQPTMQDSYKLTSASRTGDVNEGTSNLTGDATGWGVLVDTVTAMMGLKGGAGKMKGVRPAFIVLPLAKAKAYGQLYSDFSPAATDVPTRRGLEILKAVLPEPVLDIGTSDTNDWFLMARPDDAEVIRVAFLGGREEPEMIIANDKGFGSMFTNDVIEAKIRHVYGIGAVDYVGIYGQAASA